MGYRELVESLREEGEEKVRAIRQAAAAEAERVRKESAARIEALRRDYARRLESAAAAAAAAILAEAEKQAARIRLEAESAFASRLYQLARASLPGLRGDGYAEVFGALAAELPPYRWETVRVNPADAELAQAFSPGARIETCDGITGGLDVATEGGKMRIDNTLDKRLERGWPELLPRLMDVAARGDRDDGTRA